MCILRSQQAGLLSRHKINMMLSQVLHVCTAGNRCHSKCGDVLGSPAGIAFVFRMFKCSVLILPHWTQWTLFPTKVRQNFMYKAFYVPLLLNNQVRSANLISRTEGPQCLGQCCRDPLGRVLGSSRGHRDHTHLAAPIKKGTVTKYFLLEQESWYKQKKKKPLQWSLVLCKLLPENTKASLTSCGQNQHGNNSPFQILGLLTQEIILLLRAYIFVWGGYDSLVSEYPGGKNINVHTKYFCQGMTRGWKRAVSLESPQDIRG